jgi:hypothetical protein
VSPNLPSTVKITNPGTTSVNPATGKETTLPPTELMEYARISQTSVANTSLVAELRATQTTVVSQWTILVKRDSALRVDSTVKDEYGRKFFVEGAVANRPEHHPKFRTAALRLISDMQ